MRVEVPGMGWSRASIDVTLLDIFLNNASIDLCIGIRSKFYKTDLARAPGLKNNEGLPALRRLVALCDGLS
jgi:hypothetical protein